MKSNSISATSEVTPLELVSAYAPFANGGIGVQPRRYVYMARITGRTMPAWTGRVYTSGSQTTSGIRRCDPGFGLSGKARLDDYEVGVNGRSDDHKNPIVGGRRCDLLSVERPPSAATQRLLKFSPKALNDLFRAYKVPVIDHD
jgi:hypothetical protein